MNGNAVDGRGLMISELSVTYRAHRPATPALDRVSLVAEPGQWWAVIGPNGAGKSTLLKAVAGLVPYTGSITFGTGSAAAAELGTARDRARVVAYVPQRPVLPPGMTLVEYALLGRTAHLGWFASEGQADREIAGDVIDRLQLGDLAARPVTDLSGGEIQRAVLARALAQQSPLLLLDEPTSALDLGHQIGVLELVDELRRERGLTVVSAMHDLSAAARFADRLALLDRGSITSTGPPDDVLTGHVLSGLYRSAIEVLAGSDGRPVVVSLRPASPERLSEPAPAAVTKTT
jgi:iron complex transport system ATP-binding protein